jgi:PhoD-like phosphatase
MIYADNACAATGLYGNAQLAGAFGPAVDLAGFWAHWRYNRADRASRRLLASTSYVGVWDDHEVINDFGPLTDVGTAPPYPPDLRLLPIGLRAFLDYTPVASAPRLYRSLRWGRHLELFVLDTRSYRDANYAPDSPRDPKTMLGEEQLAWLKERLARSDATWKVIVSSVPMSIPTGFPPTNGRDGWANFDQATGFENELLDILRFMAENGVDDPVWITTDVHFAEAFRYTPFPEHPDFAVHEIATGPLNAGIFPNRNVDPTLNPEVLFFHGATSPADVTSWDQAKRWFNFGTLEIGAGGDLTAEVVDTAGESQSRSHSSRASGIASPPSATGRRNVGRPRPVTLARKPPPRDVHSPVRNGSPRFPITGRMSRGPRRPDCVPVRSPAGLHARTPRSTFPPASSRTAGRRPGPGSRTALPDVGAAAHGRSSCSAPIESKLAVAQQSSPRHVSRPSRTAAATMSRAAIGSSHHQPKRALPARPRNTAPAR